jgi:hypothetical protein
MSPRFLQRTVDTDGGVLEIAAEIVTDGNTFWPRKLSIFPEDPDVDVSMPGLAFLSVL